LRESSEGLPCGLWRLKIKKRMAHPVLTNIEDRIGYVVLNRPEKKHALNAEMVAALKAAFQEMAENPDVKVIVLKSTGNVFCSGADLASLQSMQHNTFEENVADSQHLRSLFQQLYTLPKIVISAVQGHALAGGCGLATVCDFTFAVPQAKFGYTEVKIGFVPAIVMFFLLRKIGESKSRQLLLQGNLIEAKQAKDFGLIYEVVEAGNLEEAVKDFALQLIDTNSGQAMGLTKQMLAQVPEMGMRQALDYAAEMNAKARASADCKKGIAAFLNKEKINW
jgi:methylglutaconyl-CoA hydratase